MGKKAGHADMSRLHLIKMKLKEASASSKYRNESGKRLYGLPLFIAVADAVADVYGLAKHERSVFLRLCIMCGKDPKKPNFGHCWPSGEYLSSLTGYAREYVSKAVTNLERIGVLSIHRRPGGSNVYQLTVPQAGIVGKPPVVDYDDEDLLEPKTW